MSKPWFRRLPAWMDATRLLCLVGFHRMKPDPDIPHTYWCRRPLCKVVRSGSHVI